MPSKYPKLRVSVPLSQPIYDLVMQTSENMGISASSFIAQIVGSYLVSQKAVYEGLKEIIDKRMEEQKIDNQTNVGSTDH